MTDFISGIFPALTTPFESGEVSVKKLQENVKKYNAVDFAGYIVLGSTGEGILMNEKERISTVETVISAAAEDKIIIVGTGMQSSRMTVEFTNRVADIGADFALIVTPFYYKGQMTASSLTLYYQEVAEQSRIPILMYNVPKFTGLNIPLEAVQKMAEHPNVAGLKESSGSIPFIVEILKDCPADFSILQGSGSALFTALIQGAAGGILALSNIAAAETVSLYKYVQTGNLDEARKIQLRLVTINQKIVGQYGVPGIKCAIDLLGFYGGDPRPPLQPVSRDIKNSIKKILTDAGLL